MRDTDRRARTLGVVVATAAMLACAACSGSDDPEPSPPAAPSTWPLTGVVADDVVQRPALAVKIENSAQARPQTGLEQADMVWEEVVEGGITRFVAVYHSQVPELVGPVRSVRPSDVGIVAPLGGMLAASGGQQPFLDALTDAGVQLLTNDAGDDGFERTSDRAAPHNVYGHPDQWWALADGDRTVPPPQQLAFADSVEASTAASQGEDAPSVTVELTTASTARWDWDADQGAYLRSEGDSPATSSDDVRLSAANVVAVSVEVVNTSYLDPAGSPVPETQLVGSGEGVVLSGGKQVEVTWSKSADDEPLELSGPDGEPVELAPGGTWVELVPQGTGSWDVG